MAQTNLKQRTAFIAALTATNQLSPRERRVAERDEQDRLKSERYVAWMGAEAAYHRAKAAEITACCARVSNAPTGFALTAESRRCAIRLRDAADKWLGSPILNTADRKERMTFLRKMPSTLGRAKVDWHEQRARWEAIIADSPLARGGNPK